VSAMQGLGGYDIHTYTGTHSVPRDSKLAKASVGTSVSEVSPSDLRNTCIHVVKGAECR